MQGQARVEKSNCAGLGSTWDFGVTLWIVALWIVGQRTASIAQLHKHPEANGKQALGHSGSLLYPSPPPPLKTLHRSPLTNGSSYGWQVFEHFLQHSTR